MWIIDKLLILYLYFKYVKKKLFVIHIFMCFCVKQDVGVEFYVKRELIWT